MTLLVAEIFDSLQGEGFWTGVPMTFVRLAGCNARSLGLGCVRWCDTPDSWDATAGRPMDVGDILTAVHFPRVCVTGGEPLLQLEALAGLLGAAGRRGLRVHLETNGTLDPRPAFCDDEHQPAWSTLSPKPPGYMVHPGWEGLVDELKLVADGALDAAVAERLADEHPGALVTIQPCWAAGGAGARPHEVARVATAAGVSAAPEVVPPAHEQSVQRAVALVMTHPEWRLSLQTHKYLGLP